MKTIGSNSCNEGLNSHYIFNKKGILSRFFHHSKNNNILLKETSTKRITGYKLGAH